KQVVEAETVAAILAAVEGLGDLDREIFRLCAAEGYGYQAAAESLGVSHGTVRNRLSRIRSRVRATAMETETP
ncbi:RNA polymerase sigma factor, partial [Staphylococcus aureus]